MVDDYTHWHGLMLFYSAFIVGLFSPGPNILMVIGTSMSAGRGAGMSVAGGVILGTFCWSVISTTGMFIVLEFYAPALFYLKVCGAVYLTWLAIKLFRTSVSKGDNDIDISVSSGRTQWAEFRNGFLVQMTNPKALLGWSAILPLCIDINAPGWVLVAVCLGATGLSTVGHLTYAVLFSRKGVMAAYTKFRRVIDATIGSFFLFAVYTLIAKIKS